MGGVAKFSNFERTVTDISFVRNSPTGEKNKLLVRRYVQQLYDTRRFARVKDSSIIILTPGDDTTQPLKSHLELINWLGVPTSDKIYDDTLPQGPVLCTNALVYHTCTLTF